MDYPPRKPPGTPLFLIPMVCPAGSEEDFDPPWGCLVWGFGSSIASSRPPPGRAEAGAASPFLASPEALVAGAFAH